MVQYHTVAKLGSRFIITIYLDVVVDGNGGFDMPLVFREAIGEIAFGWTPIAVAYDLEIWIVPKQGPVVPDGFPSPDGAVLSTEKQPQDRIVFYNDTIAPPSSNVQFFRFKIGVKDSARPETQSAKISYVDHASGKGYIYSTEFWGSAEHKLRDITHELGHVLGLKDRYYEGITWYTDEAIDRSVGQIRSGSWFDSDHKDRRFAIPGLPGSTAGEQGRAQDLPRYAERSTLLMAQQAIPADTDYAPSNNLMSSSSKAITKYQLCYIGIDKDNDAVVAPDLEPDFRQQSWIAILGDWISSADPHGRVSNSYPPREAWEDANGLRYKLPNDATVHAYPCWNGSKKGLSVDGQSVFDASLVEKAQGKEMEGRRRIGSKHYDLTKNAAGPDKSNWMRYTARLLDDLDG